MLACFAVEYVLVHFKFKVNKYLISPFAPEFKEELKIKLQRFLNP